MNYLDQALATLAELTEPDNTDDVRLHACQLLVEYEANVRAEKISRAHLELATSEAEER